MHYFTIACRIGLAWGFLPSGLVKIMGDRFTVLTTMHPMGHYLDAVYRTGFYYTLIGVTQVTAAVLLLIPRTALLGALLYLPIIGNIWLVSLSVRFEGSMVSSTLMVFANLYLLFWDYHRLRFILPWHHSEAKQLLPADVSSKRFPWRFTIAVMAVVAIVATLTLKGFDVKPRNTMKDCVADCPDNRDTAACLDFCNCIHQEGQSLDSCLKRYYRAIDTTKAQ